MVDIENLQLVNQNKKSMAKSELVMDLTIWEEAIKNTKNRTDVTVAFNDEGFSVKLNEN